MKQEETVARRKLLDLLVTHSYRQSPTASFRLASGKSSHVYVDCKMTTMRGRRCRSWAR